MLARRVSSLLGCRVGDKVGYQVRFDKKVTSATEIIYLTDGMLLQRFFSDPTLSREELIIFDEFHERSLQLDVALALAKRLCSDMRPSLRMIVTSATLDLDQVGEYLGDCGKVELRSRSFPVKVEYVSSAGREPIWKQVTEQLRKVMPRQEGDALVFMDGAYQINRTVREIQGAAWS
ncbi:MAG TPA: helicase, partial [Opitutae bacterium]|nr:helicase [Opitutae bacterium]